MTAIIDGMGSLGAALGPTVAGQIIAVPSKHNYDRVFMMLGGSSFMAGLLLVGLVFKEVGAGSMLPLGIVASHLFLISCAAVRSSSSTLAVITFLSTLLQRKQ